jgi:hypothetical protein
VICFLAEKLYITPGALDRLSFLASFTHFIPHYLFLYRSNDHRKAAQEQLARSYWETSRTAREGNQALASLHWTAEALSQEPAK